MSLNNYFFVPTPKHIECSKSGRTKVNIFNFSFTLTWNEIETILNFCSLLTIFFP